MIKQKGKKLTWSKYNIEIDVLPDGQKLIYNSRTNFLGLMDSPICQGGCPNEHFLFGEAKCPNFLYSLKDKKKLAYKNYLEKSDIIKNTVNIL